MTLPATAAPDRDAIAPQDRERQRFGRWLLGLTLLGFAVRLAFILLVQRDLDLGAGDSYYYHRGAELLVEGHGFVAPHQWDEGIRMQAASHPPVYLLYLAFFTWLGLGTPLWHMLASSVLGTGSVLLCGLIGRRLGGHRVGLIAAGLAAIYPQLWVNDGMVMSETAAIFFGLVALLCAYRFSEDRTPGRAAAMGLAIAVAALSRSELILLAPLVAVPLCLAPRGTGWKVDWRPRLVNLVAAGAAALALIGPWVGYNLSRFERPVYLSAGLEITQAVSNCDDTYSGQFLGYWSYRCQIPIDEAAEARGLDRYEESVRSQYMGEAARAYMSDHRAEIPKVVAARLGRILGVYRTGQQVDFDSFSEARPRTAAELASWGYLTLAPMAIVGAVIARRQRHLIYPLLAVVFTVLFAVVITFAGTRYRAPAEPVVVMFAAVFLNAALPRRARGQPAEQGTLDRRGHLPNLDGVRALAAIAVMTSHIAIATGAARPDRSPGFVQPVLPRLDVGVAVFFVLSGFLLFRPFARALVAHRAGPAVRPYLIRRVMRIYPLYLVILAVQIWANHAQDLAPERFGALPTLPRLLAYASLTHIYHPSTTVGPVGQAWSLGTEVSFYLFLPLFAALLAVVIRRRPTEQARIRAIAWSLAGLGLVSLATKATLALATDPTSEVRGMVTTWLPYNLDLFAMGMAIALATIAWDHRPAAVPAWTRHRYLPALSWSGALVALWVASTQIGLRPDHLLYSDAQLFTRTTLYGLVGVLVLAPAVLGPQDVGLVRRFLSSSVMVGLGLASYGIYLWHQFVGGEYYSVLHHQIFDTAFWPAFLAIGSASVALALVTYRLVEAPIQRLSARWSSVVGR